MKSSSIEQRGEEREERSSGEWEGGRGCCTIETKRERTIATG